MYRLQTLTPVTVKQCFAATKAEGDVDWSFEGHRLGHVKRSFSVSHLFSTSLRFPWWRTSYTFNSATNLQPLLLTTVRESSTPAFGIQTTRFDLGIPLRVLPVQTTRRSSKLLAGCPTNPSHILSQNKHLCARHRKHPGLSRSEICFHVGHQTYTRSA
jgi:hypothetical protein